LFKINRSEITKISWIEY